MYTKGHKSQIQFSFHLPASDNNEHLLFYLLTHTPRRSIYKEGSEDYNLLIKQDFFFCKLIVQHLHVVATNETAYSP